MRLEWQYELPATAEVRDYQFASPICAVGGQVYFPTRAWMPGEREAVTVHRVDVRTSRAEEVVWDYPTAKIGMPSEWSFIRHGEALILSCPRFLQLLPERRELEGYGAPKVAGNRSTGRGTFILWDGRLIFADQRRAMLHCFDLASHEPVWETDLGHSEHYPLGPPALCGETLWCYGGAGLHGIDPRTGEIERTLRIRHIDKLHPPIREGDDLLMGYTNWSVAGVVRYSLEEGRVVWRYRRNTSGPSYHASLLRYEDVVVWVRGENGIVGVDVETGQARWEVAAAPWLYSELELVDGLAVYGTAGRDGFIQALDVTTGELAWQMPLTDGCQYFALYDDSVLVGDYEGCLHRLDARTGEPVDRLDLGAGVVGDVHVSGDSAFTVIWCDDRGHAPRLVCVTLQ